ncbi:hypothetical protein QR680_018484 [Steinernema hermaphroditum]|uniref:Uncharacterized protein n=1 Tax=Steinernema hermaphroditum TaxID=289476 RepID=A0AA39LQX1_9BILA|nr:hypothetical protein QR680_018482 [Steinernema hermaphroditum]KAK0406293.1 hypothetical protein QR680_018484 [Steinernema hermaphroditum]
METNRNSSGRQQPAQSGRRGNGRYNLRELKTERVVHRERQIRAPKVNVRRGEKVRQPHTVMKQENSQDRGQAVEMTSIRPSPVDPIAALQVPSFPIPPLAAAAPHIISVSGQEFGESLRHQMSNGRPWKNSFERTEADEVAEDVTDFIRETNPMARLYAQAEIHHLLAEFLPLTETGRS